jgi:hypothetical protein
MFEEYTTNQLVELRLWCTDLIVDTNDFQKRGDALLLLKQVDEELANRRERQSA